MIDWAATTDAALVAAAFLAVGAAFWQVELTRRAARRQLRAYADISEINVLQSQDGADLDTISLKVRNFGQTPALNCGGHFTIENGAESAKLSTPAKTIAPGGEFNYVIALVGLARANLRARPEQFRIEGSFTYADVFGENQVVGFSMYVDPITKELRAGERLWST